MVRLVPPCRDTGAPTTHVRTRVRSHGRSCRSLHRHHDPRRALRQEDDIPVPDPHRSPTADRDLAWDWGSNAPAYTNELIEHGGWHAMVTAHAWHAGTDDGPPQRKKDYKLPHHRLIDGRIRVVLEGVRSAMNILAATRFQPGDYRVDIPAEDIPEVYEHLAVHLEEFGETRPDILKGWSPQDGWPPS